MLIVGTGGHAKDLLSDGSLLANRENIYFFDSVNDFPEGLFLGTYRVIKDLSFLPQIDNKPQEYVLALGGTQSRRKLYEVMELAGLLPYTFISRYALKAESATIGDAVNLMPFSSVLGNTFIGKGTLVNSYASVHHDTVIGTFSEISPGARILGRTIIGSSVMIGANAVILPGVSVGDNAIIGAGAVVTKDIPEGCTAVGVPAKIVKNTYDSNYL